jgi:hypothetical protein
LSPTLLFWIQKGIDVVLGMGRLSEHKVPIDCAKESVKLPTLDMMELSILHSL